MEGERWRVRGGGILPHPASSKRYWYPHYVTQYVSCGMADVLKKNFTEDYIKIYYVFFFFNDTATPEIYTG
ncbi:hypothetical protein BH80429_12450 [Bartonella henselae]|nr:hypothetical protein BH80429_12450 [Bartonella henselae]